MKKYIKYYNEDSKKMERFAATKDITVHTAFFADRLEINLVKASTGETLLTLILSVMDKTLEDFCKTLQKLCLSIVVESAYRKIVTDEYKKFLSSDRVILPIDKVCKELVFEYNLFLQMSYNEMGKQAKDLERDFAKIFRI